MSTSIHTSGDIMSILETTLIRDLVERWPATMPILAGYGIDLCCGGGHTVVEAAKLHELDLDRLVGELRPILEHEEG